MEEFTCPYSVYPIKLRQHILYKYISKLKAVDSIYFYFYFYFYLFSIFLFLECRVRVRVMRSCCHTSVTSDDTATVTVISHKTYERMISYNVYNIQLFRVSQKQLAWTMRFLYIRQTILYRVLYQVLLYQPNIRFFLLTNTKIFEL